MGSYSLTRGQTQAQCIGIAESKALNHQRSPYVSLSFLFSFLSFTFFVKSKRWKVEPRPALPPTHTPLFLPIPKHLNSAGEKHSVRLYSLLLFIYLLFLFFAALGLHCCVQAFSYCGERGLLSSCHGWAALGGSFSCCKGP